LAVRGRLGNNHDAHVYMWTWAIAAAFAAAEADPELTRQLAVGIEAGDPASVRQLVTRLVWLEDAVQALQSELAEWRASQPKASCSGSPEAADDKCKEMKAAGEHCAVAKRAGCGLTSIRKAGYTATKRGSPLQKWRMRATLRALWQRDTQHRRRRRLGIQAARRKLLALYTARSFVSWV